MPRLRELVLRLAREAGVRPSRRLGQHFLVDERGPRVFLSAFPPGARSALEIGPGLGSITLPASRVLPSIVAVEADPRIVKTLRGVLPGNVALVMGDGVRALEKWPVELVYSNTPFNLTGEIIEAAARNNRLATAVLGVQREVAARITAEPGSSDYGRLSVLAQLLFTVEVVGAIPPWWYYPRPEVWTSVVRLVRRRRWSSRVEEALRLARCAFTRRNKLAVRVLEECLGRRLRLPCLAPSARVRGVEPECFLKAVET